MAEDLISRDARHVWHPYTQAATEPAPIAVRSASGARLVLDDGTELVDGISSWWATLHGHGEPRLVEADFQALMAQWQNPQPPQGGQVQPPIAPTAVVR